MAYVRFTRLALASALALAAAPAAAAPPPPGGGHPRLFLASKVKDALKEQAKDPKTPAGALIALCDKTAASFPMGSGYQGDVWAAAASGCALAWQLTGNATYAQTGAKLWRALLEDVMTLGDKKACVSGADEKTATASIRRDTGYAIRFIGPHTAVTYDWLHDAPGVDEGLRQQSRDCFRNWITYYTREGYHRTEPGANYHAGYVAAKTLIAIAEAGEDGDNSNRFWTEVVDDVFGKQLMQNGLALDKNGMPEGKLHGALVGGDWAEGWQYGPLSVLEYGLSTRALLEQGVDLPAMTAWAGDVTLRGLYGTLPGGGGWYVGGDFEGEGYFPKPNAGVFETTILGGGSDEAAGWAAFTRDKLFGPRGGTNLWSALAATRTVTPADPAMAKLPLWFLARGTRTLYARSSWGDDAFWAVFTSPPRVVSDHQQYSASNFVFSRGPDALVVDPSPYGTRSTLTSNAMTMDSTHVAGDYAPSQTPWSNASLPFSRGTASGVAAARSDWAGGFQWQDTPTDIQLAHRDWVFLPEGELVIIDRAKTPSAMHKAYLRFRTPGMLTAASNSPFIAKTVSGGSALAIHAVKLVPAMPPVLRAAPGPGDCFSDKAFGACRTARIAAQEYAWEVAGPDVTAVHVLDGLGMSEAPADVAPIDAAPIDTSPAQNAGVVGASVFRAQKQTFVLEPATVPPPASLTYGVPGGSPSRHVVFDAPADGMGRTTVTAMAAGDRCVVTLVPGEGITGAPAIFTLKSAADGCAVSPDADVAPGHSSPGSGGFERPGGDPGPGGGSGGQSGGGAGSGGAKAGGDAGGGCSCGLARTTPSGLGALALAALGAALVRRRRARSTALAARPETRDNGGISHS